MKIEGLRYDGPFVTIQVAGLTRPADLPSDVAAIVSERPPLAFELAAAEKALAAAETKIGDLEAAKRKAEHEAKPGLAKRLADLRSQLAAAQKERDDAVAYVADLKRIVNEQTDDSRRERHKKLIGIHAETQAAFDRKLHEIERMLAEPLQKLLELDAKRFHAGLSGPLAVG